MAGMWIQRIDPLAQGAVGTEPDDPRTANTDGPNRCIPQIKWIILLKWISCEIIFLPVVPVQASSHRTDPDIPMLAISEGDYLIIG